MPRTQSLLLSRRPDQSIWIGDDVLMTIVAVDGNSVRLRFTAPPHVAIDRYEVRLAKRSTSGVVSGMTSRGGGGA